eukprot:129587-Ditylum_brightwellii.AAC.1
MDHGDFDGLTPRNKGVGDARKGTPAQNSLRQFRCQYQKYKKESEQDSSPKLSIHQKVREENIQLLEDFGLVLDVPVKKSYGGWDDHLERLRLYKEREGHVKVPQLYKDDDGCSLGFWVSNQRKDYEKWCCRQTTPMNPDRIMRLEELGFTWKLRYGRPKRHEERFRNKAIGVGYNASGEENDKNKSDSNSTGE